MIRAIFLFWVLLALMIAPAFAQGGFAPFGPCPALPSPDGFGAELNMTEASWPYLPAQPERPARSRRLRP